MLPQNKGKVLLQNTASPEYPHHVLEQFVHSPRPNLASLFPHQTLPSSHIPHFYSSDLNSDSVVLPCSSSHPSSSSCCHQNYTYFGETLSSPHSTSPSNDHLCLSPPLTSSSSPSQLQNSSPHSFQSPSRLQDFQSSTITSHSPTSPSGGIQRNKEAEKRPPFRSSRSSGVAGGCKPRKVDPAEFRDPGALAQVIADNVGRRRIALDLKIQIMQHMLQGTTSPVLLVEYPVCLVCLQPRTPSCPTSKYKSVPRLLAFPQLLPPAQESGRLRMGIGFGFRMARGEAKAWHLLPKKSPAGVQSQEEALPSQKPTTFFQAGSLRSVDLQSPKPRQCSGALLPEPRQATASPKPRPSVSRRSSSPRSILRKPPS